MSRCGDSTHAASVIESISVSWYGGSGGGGGGHGGSGGGGGEGEGGGWSAGAVQHA